MKYIKNGPKNQLFFPFLIENFQKYFLNQFTQRNIPLIFLCIIVLGTPSYMCVLRCLLNKFMNNYDDKSDHTCISSLFTPFYIGHQNSQIHVHDKFVAYDCYKSEIVRLSKDSGSMFLFLQSHEQ